MLVQGEAEIWGLAVSVQTLPDVRLPRRGGEGRPRGGGAGSVRGLGLPPPLRSPGLLL